jgi:ceramide glucosyltransferase
MLASRCAGGPLHYPRKTRIPSRDHSQAVASGPNRIFRAIWNLFAQAYDGAVQVVFGVHDERDPRCGGAGCKPNIPSRSAIVVDRAVWFQRQVSNLINMRRRRVHTLVLSDSDIAVGPQWLSQVTAALARPGVGVVTCLYTGEPAGRSARRYRSPP